MTQPALYGTHAPLADGGLVHIAQDCLARAWRRPVELGANTMPVPERHHAVVMRCPVTGALDMPPTVVIKTHRGWQSRTGEPELHWKRRFNPDSKLFPTPDHRFRQEVAGLRFMREASMPVAAPRVHAHDSTNRCVVMEDLGDHDTVLEPLLGKDSMTGAHALLALTLGMARLHAASVGREALLLACGSRTTPRDADWTAFSRGLRACVDLARANGIAEPPDVRADLEVMRGYFTEGTEPLVFSPGDVGPGNQFLIDGEVVLFDFEFSRYRHHALELANILLPFPVVYTASGYPDDLAEEMAELYFAEAGHALGNPGPRERQRARVYGTAWWTFASVGADLEAALVEDYPWGMATSRQRHLQRLTALATMANVEGLLPALGEFAARLRTALAATWPAADQFPRYPAFQNGLAG